MNSFIFALLSIVVLAPFLFFLKSDFTNKGKIFILGLALAISFISLASRTILPLWQTFLILLLFVILTVMLGYKRLETVIFMKEDEGLSRESKEEIFQQDISLREEPDEIQRGIVKETVEELHLLNPSEEEFEGLAPVVETINLDDFRDENQDNQDQTEPLNSYEDEWAGADTKGSDLNVIDYTTSTENSDVSQAPQVNQEISPNHYMAELEKLIVGEEVGMSDALKTNDKEESDTDPVVLDTWDFETLATPSLPMFEEIAAGNEAAQEESMDELAENEQMSEITEIQLEQKQTEDIQKQLFLTMISQIQLARKLIDSNKYEEMLTKYLHPKLPISEYYTFAHFLIQYYISKKQMDKLLPLLDDLEEKVTQHPILLQEIQFFKSLYSKK